MLLARALGIVGILGTVALAVVALGPRTPAVADRVEGVSSRSRLPWDPALTAGPAPLALDRTESVAPLAVTFTTFGVAPTPLATPTASAIPTPPATPTPSSVADPSPPTKSPSAPESAEEQRSVTHPEPRLSPEEIRLRRARYEQWLKDQGLKRIE